MRSHTPPSKSNRKSTNTSARARKQYRRKLVKEQLETRWALAPMATYVDDSWALVPFGNDPDGAGPATAMGTDAFATLQAGVNAVDVGGTVTVNEGTYIHSGQLDIGKALTIVGAGQDQTIIKRAGSVTGTEHRTIQINATDVTFQSLTLGGWENAPANANVGSGYLVWLNADEATFDDVRFDGNDNRVAIYLGTFDDFTVTNSRFTGTYFRSAIRGAGERMEISYNSFEESHYWYGPIYFEYGAATSGNIHHNYFANRVGVNNQVEGNFKSDGTGLYTITNYQPHTTTADGLYINYNTFDFQDSNLVNDEGASPVPTGVYIDPLLSPTGPIVVQDNIFQGFQHTGPQPSTSPAWQPGGGVFGGALEFDGVDDFAVFQSPLFDVGTRGTLNFWVQMDDVSRRNQLFEGPGNSGFEVQFRDNSGGQLYSRTTTVGGDFVIRSGGDGAVLGDTNWHNVQIIYDFAGLPVPDGGGRLRIFIDGAESGYLGGFTPTDLTWASVVSTVGGLMNIGRDPGDLTRFFDGMLDDIGWFDNVLSAAERTLIRNAGVAALAADPRLVAHWDLDTVAGDTEVDNKNGIVLYVSANGGLPATEFGPQLVGGGQFGGALEFDGTDDFATFDFGGNELGDKGTLNFWVMMDDVGRRNQFFEGPGNGGFETQYRTNSGGQFYSRTTIDGGDVVIRSGGDSSASGVWTNLQVTWDFNGLPGADGGGNLRIYRDGVESSYLGGFTPTDLTWPSIVTTVNGIMSVGRDPGDLTRFFDGKMDDIAWFDDVLSAAERTTLRTLSGSAFTGDTRMVAYWNLDDAPGTTILPGDGGTNIDLYLQSPPPPAPKVGYAINASPTVLVDNNVFWNNEVNYNNAVTIGPNSNIVGDPKFQEIGPATSDYYALRFGSAALYQGTGGGIDTVNIGAYQGPPVGIPTVVYVDDTWPSLYVVGDLIVDADDGTLGDQPAFYGYDAFATINLAVSTVDVGGNVIVNEGSYLESVSLTNSITLEITGPDAAQNVTIGSLESDSSAAIVLEGSSQLTVGDGSNRTIAGQISGSGSLVKAGAGILTLSNANTYTGVTTINAGTVNLTGSLVDGAASDDVVVNTGTLTGTGIIDGAVIANAGGSVSAGTVGTVGTLTINNNLSFNGGTLIADINGNASDQLVVSGIIDLKAPAGSIFSLGTIAGAAPSDGNIFTLINNTAAGAIVDAPLTGAPEGGAAVINTKTAYFSYAAGTGGNDFALTVTGAPVLSGSGDLEVRRVTSGPLDNVQLLQGGIIIDSRPLASITSPYVVNGSAGADKLTINYTTVAPASGFIPRDITFNGGNGSDELFVSGGSFGAIVYNLANATDGTIQNYADAAATVLQSIIAFTSVEPTVESTSTATNARFNLPAASGDVAVVYAVGGGQHRINSDSLTFNSVEFIMPTTTMTVNGGGGIDLLFTDTLAVVDVGTSGAAGIVVTKSLIQGLPTTGGANIAFTNIDTLDVTTTAGVDNITVNMPAGASDLESATIRGGQGRDTFDIVTVEGLQSLTLVGNGPFAYGVPPLAVGDHTPDDVDPTLGDLFGVSAEGIRPSLTTTINIVGGDPTVVVGDTLRLDISAVQASTAVPVVVDTVAGIATSASHKPVLFTEIETVDLYDNRQTSVQSGDLYVRGSNSNDRILLYKGILGGVRVRQNNKLTPDTYYPTRKVIVDGALGNDTLTVNGYLGVPVELYGGIGNDYLTGGEMDDLLDGGPGTDRLLGNPGNDTLLGGPGNDRFNGSAGDDYLYGDSYVDALGVITEGNPALHGKDNLSGDAGDDHIYGQGGDDSLYGGLGNDWMRGGQGKDFMSGDAGEDLLAGDSENDKLYGRAGNDVLLGGAGADLLYGGTGDDMLFGSALTSDTDVSLLTIASPWISGDQNLAIVALESLDQNDSNAVDKHFGEAGYDYYLLYLMDALLPSSETKPGVSRIGPLTP